MEKEKYVLNTKGKIVVVLYCLVVLTILALIVLNTTTLLKLENIDTVNFYTTFVASLMFVGACILQVSREILKKKYKENKLLKEDVLSCGFIVALCFLVLRIILKDNKFVYAIYTAVMTIALILFLVKEMFMFSMDSEKSNNYIPLKILLYTLIFVFAVVYLVLFFNAVFEEIAGQIITIIASVIGGLLTLSGVSWTIRRQDKQRELDEKRRYKPIVLFSNGTWGKGNLYLTINEETEYISFKKTDTLCVENYINTASFYNTEFTPFYLRGLVVNGNNVLLPTKLYINKEQAFTITFNQKIVYTKKIIDEYSLLIQDLLGNYYKFPFRFRGFYSNSIEPIHIKEYIPKKNLEKEIYQIEVDDEIPEVEELKNLIN